MDEQINPLSELGSSDDGIPDPASDLTDTSLTPGPSYHGSVLADRFLRLSTFYSLLASLRASDQEFATARNLPPGVSAERAPGSSRDVFALWLAREAAYQRWWRLYEDPACAPSNPEMWAAMLRARTAYSDATLAWFSASQREQEGRGE